MSPYYQTCEARSEGSYTYIAPIYKLYCYVAYSKDSDYTVDPNNLINANE